MEINHKAYESPVTINPPPNMSIAPVEDEYFFTPFTHSLLKTYTREITVVSSTICVLALMIIGTCIWCIAKLFQSDGKLKPGDGVMDQSSDSSVGSHPSKFFKGWKPPPIKESTSTKSSSSQSLRSNSSPPWDSKRLGMDRNIITPDKNIEFVVPTVMLLSYWLYKIRLHNKYHVNK